MFLNGEAMRGRPLHENVADAPFLGPARTAPRYRFYSVRDEFPGLARAMSAPGYKIEGELYEISEETLRDRLLPNEPPELELGVIELEDGTAAFSMLLRSEQLGSPELLDISEHGGWRNYMGDRLRPPL